MTEENGQVFIGSGQSFFFCLVIFILWFLMNIGERCLNQNNKLLRMISFLYVFVLGLVFFDYQAICVAEIAFFDYTRIREISAKFKYSLFFSVATLILIAREFLTSFYIIRQKTQTNKENKEKEEQSTSLSLSPYTQMIFEKYTEVLNLDEDHHKQSHLLVIIGDVRFFIIQIMIVTLQHLNRTQSVLVLMAQLAYFLYFIKVLIGPKVFESKAYMIKQIIQEVCILVFITTITLFSFTENTKFSTSLIYKLVEYVTIVSIIGACGTEFFILMKELVGQLVWLYTKIRSLSQKKNAVEKMPQAENKNKQHSDFGRLEEEEIESKNNRKMSHEKKKKTSLREKRSKIKKDKVDPESSRRFLKKKAQEKDTKLSIGSERNKISIFEKENNKKGEKKT